jgi:hypothetical protein
VFCHIKPRGGGEIFLSFYHIVISSRSGLCESSFRIRYKSRSDVENNNIETLIYGCKKRPSCEQVSGTV